MYWALADLTILRGIEEYVSCVCKESRIVVPSVWSNIQPSSCSGLLRTFTVLYGDPSGAALKLRALIIRSIPWRWWNSAPLVLTGGSGGWEVE